jgi:predicted P-loop ATPase
MPKPSRALVPIKPIDRLPTDFVDFMGSGASARPKDTMMNALIALDKLGLDCRYNIFKNEFLISGKVLASDVGELSDLSCLALRQAVRENFLFEPSKNNMQDAATRFCTMRTFHPIKDYLAALEWDGLPRIEFLLEDYFNAKPTPFNRAVSRIVLMASVRRIDKPGTKFDYMTVLRSAEGFNKSSAIETLYGGPEYFTDQSIIGLNTRDTEEALRGKWANEAPELSGISKADWNKLKASLSRTHDRTRRVFDRNLTGGARTSIPWGTTNDDQYLRALSGMNRRFFSVDVQAMIDLDKLRADRDQIWAEAVVMEARGEAISLPSEFWDDANAERILRTEADPWEDILCDVADAGAEDIRATAKRGKSSQHYEETDDEERVSSRFVLDMLGIRPDTVQPQHASRVARVMKSQGWAGPSVMKIGGKPVRGYKRAAIWA